MVGPRCVNAKFNTQTHTSVSIISPSTDRAKKKKVESTNSGLRLTPKRAKISNLVVHAPPGKKKSALTFCVHYAWLNSHGTEGRREAFTPFFFAVCKVGGGGGDLDSGF